jgi:glycerophosphoryl diester phosphodiesterase
MEVIAHRGASFEAPENTLTAFRLGWAQAAACELDIWPTSDGRLLVCHDSGTKRTTGKHLLIAQHTLAELHQLDAGSWKDPRYAGEKLPSLAEVLGELPAGKSLFIEVKGDDAIVAELKREMETSGKLSQLEIHSFDYPTCVTAKKLLPDTPVSYLSHSGASIDDLIAKAVGSNLDGLSLQDHPMIEAATVQKIHDAGLTVRVWTVDDLDEARRLRACGIDGVITNRPGWLRSQLDLF